MSKEQKLNQELAAAVEAQDLEGVQAAVAAGANVNYEVQAKDQQIAEIKAVMADNKPVQ